MNSSVVECRTPEREVRGSRPTSAVLCPWARHFTPRKYWLITQEAMAPSRHDWKIVDWDVKPQHNQPTYMNIKGQDHSVTLVQGHSDSTFANFFSLETAKPIEARFHMEPPWDGGTSLFKWSRSHDQYGRHAHMR